MGLKPESWQQSKVRLLSPRVALHVHDVRLVGLAHQDHGRDDDLRNASAVAFPATVFLDVQISHFVDEGQHPSHELV